jgi:hypothetical protein
MRAELLHLEQKDILDIVFAIIIGNGVIKIPNIISAAFKVNLYENLITLILLLTTILFSILYWIETREFIREENLIAKNTNVKFHINIYASRVFVLSSFFLVIFSGVMIEFAEFNHFNTFLIVNMLFWLSDFGGTILLKRNNKRYCLYFRDDCNNLKLSSWFLAHFDTNFFNLYGILNFLFYLLVYIANRFFHNQKFVQLNIALILIFFVFFRHFCWRIYLYNQNQKKIMKFLYKSRKCA